MRKGTILMATGLLMMAAALFIACCTFHQELQAETAVQAVLAQMPQATAPEETGPEIDFPDYVENPDMEMPIVIIDGNEYIGTLDIPTQDLSLPIMSTWDYPKFQIAPCRYVGSVYQDNLVIAAHNYQKHFGPLKDLRLGDTITFTDMDGNVFSYQVADVEVLQPSAVEEMVGTDFDLTLFTCTYGGRTRFTVRCVRIR